MSLIVVVQQFFLNCLQFFTVLTHYEYFLNKEISLENDKSSSQFEFGRGFFAPRVGKTKTCGFGHSSCLIVRLSGRELSSLSALTSIRIESSCVLAKTIIDSWRRISYKCEILISYQLDRTFCQILT